MDVVSILTKLESLGYIRLSRIIGNYYQIFCPIHNNGKERKPSCGVLLEDEVKYGRKYAAGTFHCFGCNFTKPMAEAVTDILKMHSVSKSGLEWLKENIEGFDDEQFEVESLIPQSLLDELNDKYAIKYIQSLTNSAQTFVSEEELANYRFTVPYMYERRLTDDIIDKFDIGFDANYIPYGRKKPVPSITFPVRNREGSTLFISRRSIEGKFFSLPQGITKPVYGIYELGMYAPKTKRVVICESVFNCTTSWAYGMPAVALFGTGNAYQIEQLKTLGVREFILAFDPDEAGQKATAKLKRALKNVALISTFTDIPQGKDINDLTKEEFDNLTIE